MNEFWLRLLERLMHDKPDDKEEAAERERRVREALSRAAHAQARVRAIETEIKVVRRDPL